MVTAYFINQYEVDFTVTDEELKIGDPTIHMTMIQYIAYALDHGCKLVKLEGVKY